MKVEELIKYEVPELLELDNVGVITGGDSIYYGGENNQENGVGDEKDTPTGDDF